MIFVTRSLMLSNFVRTPSSTGLTEIVPILGGCLAWYLLFLIDVAISCSLLAGFDSIVKVFRLRGSGDVSPCLRADGLNTAYLMTTHFSSPSRALDMSIARYFSAFL